MDQVQVKADLIEAQSTVVVSASHAAGGQLLTVAAGAYDVTVQIPQLPIRAKWRVGTSGDWNEFEGGEGFTVSGADSARVYLAKFAEQSASVTAAVKVRTVGSFTTGSAQVGLVTTKTDPVTGVIDISGFTASEKYRYAVLGDSIAEQSSSAYSVRAKGIVPYALCYAGWNYDFDHSDNFAVFGTGLAAIIATQLPAFIEASKTKRYKRVFVSAGTNDTNDGRSITDIKADYSTLFAGIRSTGAQPSMWGIFPRGVDAAITVAKQKNLQLNEWLYAQSKLGVLDYFDLTGTFADNSTAFGNCLPALMYDGLLHPADIGGALGGYALAQMLQRVDTAPKLKFATQQADVFDRVNNPTGVAFNAANPLMQGGTTAPTGMTTTGGTWSKVSRNLANEQTRSDPQCVLAASTTHYLYDDWVASGAWGATQLQPGDLLEARALIEISSGVNIKNVMLELSENNGGGGISYQCLTAGTPQALPNGNHVLYLKTPPAKIRAYAGSGNASVFARLNIITDAGASGTAVVRGFEQRVVSMAV